MAVHQHWVTLNSCCICHQLFPQISDMFFQVPQTPLKPLWLPNFLKKFLSELLLVAWSKNLPYLAEYHYIDNDFQMRYLQVFEAQLQMSLLFQECKITEKFHYKSSLMFFLLLLGCILSA